MRRLLLLIESFLSKTHHSIKRLAGIEFETLAKLSSDIPNFRSKSFLINTLTTDHQQIYHKNISESGLINTTSLLLMMVFSRCNVTISSKVSSVILTLEFDLHSAIENNWAHMWVVKHPTAQSRKQKNFLKYFSLKASQELLFQRN